MKIQIENYILDQEPHAPTKFSLTVIKKHGGKSKNAGKEYKKVIAYGISIQHAIEIIISNETMEDGRTVSLREYVQQYNEQLEKFTALLKEQQQKSPTVPMKEPDNQLNLLDAIKEAEEVMSGC